MQRREKPGFIYLITNTVDQRCYVGQTVMNPPTLRFSNHKRDLKAQKHNPKFTNFTNKYGIKVLKFQILASNIYGKILLDSLEKYYIKLYNSYENGFNCTEGGDQPYNYKREISLKNIEEDKIYNFQSIAECAEKIGASTGLIHQLIDTKKTNIVKKKWCRSDYKPKYYEIIDKSGQIYKFLNIAEFSKQHNFPAGRLQKIVSGSQFQWNGWKLAINKGKNKEVKKICFSIYKESNIKYYKNFKTCARDLGFKSIRTGRYKVSQLITGKIDELKGWKLNKSVN